MSKETITAKEQLRVLEKTIKKIVRKSLKDNTLDYTVQISISNLEPDKVKYSAQISSPAKGVQPITFIFDSFKELQATLEGAVDGIDREQVELTFLENFVISSKNRMEAAEARIEQIKNGEFDADDIALEEV